MSRISRLDAGLLKLSARLPLARRHFHSVEHPSDQTKPTLGSSDSLLKAAYVHVPRYGFSQQALAAGARTAGYLDISPSVLADGPFHLIQYHLELGRQRIADLGKEYSHQPHHSRSSGSVDARIETLLWKRLLANQHIIHQWQQVRRLSKVYLTSI